jgi:hypothetical protein
MTDNPNVAVGGGWSGENCRTDDDRNKYDPDDDRSAPAHGWKLEATGKFLLSAFVGDRPIMGHNPLALNLR